MAGVVIGDGRQRASEKPWGKISEFPAVAGRSCGDPRFIVEREEEP
jgi:hypothetical protein